MKRILIAAAAILCMTAPVSAQSGLGSLLGKVVGSLTQSSLSAETLVGTWKYTGSAISFKSEENALSNLASGVAEGTLAKQLDTYLAKVGISSGLFGFTFNADGTMSIQYGSRHFSGTWTLDSAASTVKMKLAGLFTATGQVSVSGGTMQLLFDSTTLMKIIKSLTTVYNNSTLQTLNSILNQYDKMYAGFKMTK